jgi:DUF1365 family protein
MLYLDLAELPELFDPYWLWSARQPAPAWFRRSDHFGDPSHGLEESVRDLVHQSTGKKVAGPVRLLTHLRYFGYCMNPVSFYYCWDSEDRSLEAVVAEVHNTPWGERHCYVLDADGTNLSGSQVGLRFDKAFHVSPFMQMDIQYDWRFAAPGPQLSVHMENLAKDQKIFDATMLLQRRELNGRNLRRALLKYPWMTGKVIGAIYWQALRLWLKRFPFYEHPQIRERVLQDVNNTHSNKA